MFNLPINEYSSIIQPFFDGGESYVGHHKYSLLSRYTVTPEGAAKQTWEAVAVTIEPKSTVTLETQGLNIDISEYSRFRFFGNANTHVNIKVYCNGELVINENGRQKNDFLDGSMCTTQTVANSLKMVFTNNSDADAGVTMYYIGMLNDTPKRKNPFNAEWEGCFTDEPSMELYDEFLISKEELEAIRKRVKDDDLKDHYAVLKAQAEEYMKMVPEDFIDTHLSENFRGKIKFVGGVELAVVGQIEQNPQMIKMACRYALSLASCSTWSETEFETIQGITWHHRSFLESEFCAQVANIISLCGNFLTWHGRNYIYNALIMKGLPRIEADFHTMEYIYHCNQGLVFLHGYMAAVVSLSKQYPRYAKKIEEAQRLMNEFFETSIQADGTTDEGPGYWSYTMIKYLDGARYLARYKGISLKELVGEQIKNTAQYGIMLIDEAANTFSVSDSHRRPYSKHICLTIYEATGDERWARAAELAPETRTTRNLCDTAHIVPEKKNIRISPDFYCNKAVGYTRSYRDGINIFTVSGPSNNTHAHSDKGTFIIIDENNKDIIPDIMAGYGTAGMMVVGNSSSHSLAVPVYNGKCLNQLRGADYGGEIIKAELKDGVFEWQSDNTNAWDKKYVLLSKRTIISPNAKEYIITDEFELTEEMPISFRINVYNRDDVIVEPQNWKALSNEFNELCDADDGMVYQYQLLSEKSKSHKLITKVTIK